MKDAVFAVVDVYKVPSPRGEYVNVTLECDLDLHTEIIGKKTLIFGFAEVRVFESVDILQCGRCLGFGHLAGACKGSLHCRRCSGDHLTAECTTPEVSICINCAEANKKGTTYKTNHSPTDARCPIKAARIAGLKSFHGAASKN